MLEQPWSIGLRTCLSSLGSCVRVPPRLEGSQCHPPPQGGTGCGNMDDISPSPTVGPALSRPGVNKKVRSVGTGSCVFFLVTSPRVDMDAMYGNGTCTDVLSNNTVTCDDDTNCAGTQFHRIKF